MNYSIKEIETKDNNDLVNILDIDNTLIVDLCLYNGSTIFNKEYNTNNAYLKKHIALKLKKANDIAKTNNLRIKVCDAYRPYSITKKHAIMRPDLVEKGLLAPSTGSWHNAGLAIDVTLVDESGEELLMPSKVQDFEAVNNYIENENSLLLKKIMNEAGFGKLKSEWWHYQDIYDENKNKLKLGSKEAPVYTFEI